MCFQVFTYLNKLNIVVYFKTSNEPEIIEIINK